VDRGGDVSSPIRSYAEAVCFLEQGLNYEKTLRWKYDKQWLDLNRMDHLLAELGNPHRDYRIIHVAGTKGKGTTAGAASSCLHGAGYRAALLTSPHLVTPRERNRVDGRMMPEEAFTRIARDMQAFVEAQRRDEAEGLCRAPTYFEMLTAMGFRYFADRKVDWAVVEVGLGGRLDSTNVVDPACCIITMIGLDHTRKLGTTPEAIAREKAGILKDGVPVVLGRQRHPAALEVLRQVADERKCPRWEVGRELEIRDRQLLSAPVESPDAPAGWRFSLITPTTEYPGLCTPLLGAHQLDNLAAAVGALEMAGRYGDVQISAEQIAAAIGEFRMPARIEVLRRNPGLVLDVAHTVESTEALLAALDAHFPGRRLRVIFGCSSDKDAEEMLRLLLPRCTSLTATQARLSRAMPAERLAELADQTGLAGACGGVRVTLDPWEAIQDALARAGRDDVICATGSFYTAGEIRAAWQDGHPEVEA
jgi:dihydrofolate synthase/folylpolyglutamate synthase